jgi:F0F1-type ATP synthase delta subunit
MTIDPQIEQRLLSKIRELSPFHLQKLEELINQISQIDDSSIANYHLEKKLSLLELAGIFEDDPSFDEFVEVMAEERRRLYLEEMAAYDEEEIAAA